VDREEALKVAADKADVLRTWSYDELVAGLLKQPQVAEVTAASGATYQLEWEAFWDSGDRGGDVRVVVCVDDGGMRAFSPLSIDFIMAPDGTFVGD
jgi:hypothetical protein